MRKKTATFLILSFALLLWVSHPLLAQKEPGQSQKGATSKWEQANTLFLKGKDYFAKKELGRAETEFKACLEILPGHAEALFFLAQVDYAKGDFARALAEIQKADAAHAAMSGGGGFVDADSREALLEERAEKEREVAFIEDTLTASPCKSDVQLVSLPEAIENLRREISSINAKLNEQWQPEPQPLPADYFFVHANILFKMKRFQEAQSFYLKAIDADPRHLPAYNNLINLCYVTRDFEKALKFIEQAEANGVALNPKLKEAIIQLAKK